MSVFSYARFCFVSLTLSFTGSKLTHTCEISVDLLTQC